MAYKEKDTKKWTAQWFETNAKGEKKKRRKRGFETKREALEYERQKKLNNSRSMDMKLSEFMEVYFDDKQNELKERTMKNKRYMMEQHIIPYFGNQMMSEITAGQIIQWQKLKVFDRNGVYLPTKKIGKNNPKAEQIKTDNQYRVMWNQTVDRALISGVPEGQILEVKQSEIGQKVKASIQKSERNPALLKSLIMTAIYALELLIGKVFKMVSQKADKGIETVIKAEPEQTPVKAIKSFVKAESELVPEMPKKSALASKYPRLADIYNKLEKQNTAIYEREQQLASVEKEFAGAKGIFKAKQRKELQEQAEQLKTQIANMKQYLSSIVQGYGYKNVKEFLAEFKVSKAEYADYQSTVAEWEQQTGNKAESDSLKAKLQIKTQEVKERENNRQSYHYRNHRGGR